MFSARTFQKDFIDKFDKITANEATIAKLSHCAYHILLHFILSFVMFSLKKLFIADLRVSGTRHLSIVL